MCYRGLDWSALLKDTTYIGQDVLRHAYDGWDYISSGKVEQVFEGACESQSSRGHSIPGQAIAVENSFCLILYILNFTCITILLTFPDSLVYMHYLFLLY
mgnify:CR=1 FL=1